MAANVRARMGWLNLGPTEMAKRIGLNQTTFSNKFRGLREFRAEELEAVAREMGLPDPGPLFTIPPGFGDPFSEESVSACTRLALVRAA